MKLLINKIKRSGIIDTIFFAIITVWQVFLSKGRVISLQMRGYKIDLNVRLHKDIIFFQNKKHHVTINALSDIGSGVRIKTGFGGKIIIGKNVLIDDYSFISAQESIKIGDDTMIAANVYIVDFDHKYPLTKYRKFSGKKEGYNRAPIVIGKGVWIGTHAIILPGVTIGDGAVIGAGAIVTKSVPSFSVAVGNPAKVIKRIK
ncbi:MAG: acetyltransferase [Candidatus Levybacteria bacterium CG_4_10_14_0_2_um_filter_36_16]|nr:MAG: hypothetical protein AUK12_00740 [Candidatus Levybacteria bacterium CG2_30_37_29]PIR78845.1 MAG: acetyltransferase [Candidatus Levybacteria bacterium CG10_big_fil_rev_8_21_14_0_10_36_30]PIZ97439.1 MAG: acetyltransferase [Candidatus Levybacteria bacterium CG_4_10_14_0_2_um_filter_36_16]